MTAKNNAATSRIAILGCGFMGTALLKGWLKGENATGTTYAAHVRTPASKAKLQRDVAGTGDQVQISCGDDGLVRAASGADVVLIGVPPGDMNALLGVPGLILELQDKVVVSMLAGVSTNQIQDSMNAAAKESGIESRDWPVARIIPTLAATIGQSVTLLASDPSTEKPEHITTVEKVFSPLGAIHHIPERLMNEATAVGAAIHALAITAVESATDASVADGVPRSVALVLAAQCLQSCSGLMLDGGMSPEQVKAAMSTPGGITLNSIVKLDESVRPGIAGAVRNAIAYTRVMSG